ncbi:kinetochore-associated Ndc80 complex subunit [Saccharomycopsis crataegensis]|uniref:Kinetochore-associated Ndc80 complex subunit n=1 Tax=Saccharomycopsis crataegensis TaxID=43959 RepID=A0AAV5QS92_9ASCO|nr:kinetochore-associated Ndc80 complex subunit [Saccharomycopsis crataegensis]
MSRSTSNFGRSIGSSSSSIHRRNQNQHANDFFPLLSFKEIAVCLESCNINVTEENLSRPTSQFTQHLFNDLIPPEFLSTKLNKKLEKFREQTNLGDEFNDVSQSLPIIALQRELYEFMKVCGISDFNFLDIYKPDSYRLSRILSAIVNFARFKYERSNDYQELIDVSEQFLIKRNQLIDENTQLMRNIETIENKHQNKSKEKISEINDYQAKIQRDLKELKSIQDKLSQEHLNYKQKRNELIGEIELQNENIINTTRENDEIDALINKIDLKNPENTKNEINDLKKELANLKIKLTNIEDKDRKIQVTIDSIKLIGNDIESLINLKKNIKNELRTSNEQQLKLTKYNDAKDYKNSELINLNKKIQQVQQQIDNVNEKIARYSNQRQEKMIKNTDKMKALQEEYTKLMLEKKNKDKEVNEKHAKLRELTLKTKKLVDDFEEELNDTQYQVRLLWQHIEVYMKKMEMELAHNVFE